MTAANLELALPPVIVVALFLFLWDDLTRFLRSKLAEANELLDESHDGPPLRLVQSSRLTGVVERRPDERERARRERARARQPRQHTRGMRQSGE